MKVLGIIFAGFLGLAALFGLGWAVQGNSFFMYKIFAPKYEQVRHDVFKQSQAFVDGKITHLNKLRLDYASASGGHKCAVRTMALSEIATVETLDRLPTDLINWTNELKEDNSCN